MEKRTRYYQALMDIDQLERSSSVRSLKECFIIFICTFDPFKKGVLIYDVVQSFRGMPGSVYNDNTHKVYYNLTSEELGRKNSRLGNFLRYLNTAVPTDRFTDEVDCAVTEAKHNTNWRKEYMTLDMIIEEEKIKAKEDGFNDGFTNGYTEAEEITKLKTAVISVKEIGIPIDVIAEKFGIDVESLRKALQEGQ